MLYEVLIDAPPIYELITTEADSPEQARERALYSALQRQAETASVTVTAQEP